VWLLLVGERLDTREWEQWFADTACAQLLKRCPPEDADQADSNSTDGG
jgi:hypothetical protein